MRPLLLVLGVFAAWTTAAGAARAEIYPWCSNFADGAGLNCGFTTYDQCMETARGSGGYCAPNTMYTPSGAAKRPRHPARTSGPAKE
jgi:hypothetical protein